MAKLTKKQKKINEMLADFTQPTTALEAIKKSTHSGVSSTSVFSHNHGWHAQYIADVTEVGKDNKTAPLVTLYNPFTFMSVIKNCFSSAA